MAIFSPDRTGDIIYSYPQVNLGACRHHWAVLGSTISQAQTLTRWTTGIVGRLHCIFNDLSGKQLAGDLHLCSNDGLPLGGY